jgi:hypothetical protein
MAEQQSNGSNMPSALWNRQPEPQPSHEWRLIRV